MTGPSGERGTPEQQVAWLLWQVNQGYLKAEDRDICPNWFLTPEGTEHADDEAERPHWLALAREVIAAMGLEQVGSAWKQNGRWWMDGESCDPNDPECNSGESWPVYRHKPEAALSARNDAPDA